MVEAFYGLDRGLPGRPALHVGLQLPNGAQRRMDHGLDAGADQGLGVDALSAAGEGRAGLRGGSGGRGGGAEDTGDDERDGEQGGADAGAADTGHGVFLVSCWAGVAC